MKIDFHTHSTNSDWEKTPRELLEIAKNKEAVWFCITDHNIYDNELKKEFHKNGIWSPTWVEITSSSKFMPEWMKNLHITYYANQISNDIWELLKKLTKSKQYKIKLQIEKLTRFFKWNYNDFLKYWSKNWVNIDNLNSNHLFIYINSIDENKKILENIFWKNYNAWTFIVWFLQENWFDGNTWIGYTKIEEFIPNIWEYSQIWSDNKIISIAHPNYSFYQSKNIQENLDNFEKFAIIWKNNWINWVEINLKAPEIWVEKTLEVAKKVWLIITFWSDYHRKNSNDWVILENSPFVNQDLIKDSYQEFVDKIES